MAFPRALEPIPLPSTNAFHRPRPGKSGKFNKNTQLIACVQEKEFVLRRLLGFASNAAHERKRVVLPIKSILVTPDLTRIRLRTASRLNVDEGRVF